MTVPIDPMSPLVMTHRQRLLMAAALLHWKRHWNEATPEIQAIAPEVGGLGDEAIEALAMRVMTSLVFTPAPAERNESLAALRLYQRDHPDGYWAWSEADSLYELLNAVG